MVLVVAWQWYRLKFIGAGVLLLPLSKQKCQNKDEIKKNQDDAFAGSAGIGFYGVPAK